MRTRVIAGIALLASSSVVGVACSSGGSGGAKATTTSGTKSKSFDVTTENGQVSLSLDGKLPPGGPKGFPVPSGAKAAGSGSLGGASKTVLVGVYTTTGTAQDAFSFYKGYGQLTVEGSGSVGAGDAYVGTVKLGGTYSGNVTVTAVGASPYIIVVLEGRGASGSSGTTTSTTAATSSS